MAFGIDGRVDSSVKAFGFFFGFRKGFASFFIIPLAAASWGTPTLVCLFDMVTAEICKPASLRQRF